MVFNNPNPPPHGGSWERKLSKHRLVGTPCPTYRQTFDHLGRARAHSHSEMRRRVYVQALIRWLLAVVFVMGWAALVDWMGT